jgi:hypothetical protein
MTWGLSGAFNAAWRVGSVIFVLGSFRFGIFGAIRTGWQARSIQAPYKHFDAGVNHVVSVVHHNATRRTPM